MTDKPLEVFVLYATDAEQKFIKVDDEGCLAIFEDEASAKMAKHRNPCTDYGRNNYYSQKQVGRREAGLVEALEQCVTSMLDSGYRTDSVVIRAARSALAALAQEGS